MTAALFDLHGHRKARQVQDLAAAVRHREVAAALTEGTLRTVELLASHAAREGRLDLAGILGLQHALSGLRVAMEELAAAEQAVMGKAADMDAEERHG